MIKKTLHFSQAAYLSLGNRQLKVELPQEDGSTKHAQVPIEDIGVVILENPRITLTHNCIAALLENNVAVITSGSSFMPTGLLLPLEGNTLQSERFKWQIEASAPLKKNLWQQTVQAKIQNQAEMLKMYAKPYENMLYWEKQVKSGDAGNHEARAAAYYWSQIFDAYPNFLRGRNEPYPNPLLNYGYAILRAMVARALVGSGLLPTLGIYHKNKYNAYCLADDIMEPYRPFVDWIVAKWINEHPYETELSKAAKVSLMKVAELDVIIEGNKSPLMVGLQRTTASLSRCFEGVQRKIAYPQFA
ncbi:MAG: type II CRISPR-associated endonuclease Cas1 [Luteibaculaceae bacterium]